VAEVDSRAVRIPAALETTNPTLSIPHLVTSISRAGADPSTIEQGEIVARKTIPPKVKATGTGEGYVHFNDGKRVAYNVKGATGRTGGWFPITPTHVRLANAFLESQGMISSGE
jgi:hypothetical protein